MLQKILNLRVVFYFGRMTEGDDRFILIVEPIPGQGNLLAGFKLVHRSEMVNKLNDGPSMCLLNLIVDFVLMALHFDFLNTGFQLDRLLVQSVLAILNGLLVEILGIGIDGGQPHI